MKEPLDSDISYLTLCKDSSSRHLGEIHLQSGQVHRPTWRGLHRYWSFAKAEEVEYMTASHSGCYAVFSLTVASGQGGIIAVWNTHRRRWEHVSEADYVSCAMVLEDVHAVISFHHISCWGVPGHHSLFATPLNRTLNSHEDISLPVRASHSKHGFDPQNS